MKVPLNLISDAVDTETTSWSWRRQACRGLASPTAFREKKYTVNLAPLTLQGCPAHLLELKSTNCQQNSISNQDKYKSPCEILPCLTLTALPLPTKSNVSRNGKVPDLQRLMILLVFYLQVTAAPPSPFCLAFSPILISEVSHACLSSWTRQKGPYSCQQTDKNFKITPQGLFKKKSQRSP